jgi:hypothetical protein
MNMRENKNDSVLFVSIPEASRMFGIGTTMMRSVASEAGALVRIGKKILRVDVQKLKDYISTEYGTD